MSKSRWWLIVFAIWMARCGLGLASTPMGKDFSTGWKLLFQSYDNGMRVEGEHRLSLETSKREDPEGLAGLQKALDGLRLQTTLENGYQTASLSIGNNTGMTLWQAYHDQVQVVGSSLMEEALVLPLEPGDTRQDALSHLAQLPGLGLVFASPASRFLVETKDRFPMVDLLLRQWSRLQIEMAPYADENATRSSMGGVDPSIHCTTYVLDGQALAQTLFAWLEQLEQDPALQWLTQYAGGSQERRQAVDQWFLAERNLVTTMENNSSFKMRVYLGHDDKTSGITGSGTLRIAGEKVPVSVTYRRNTGSTRQTHTLQVSLKPQGSLDGISFKMSYVMTNNGKNRVARSLDASASGRWMGESFRLSLEWDYENRWKALAQSSYEENIQGSGTLDLSYGKQEPVKIKWNQTDSIYVDKQDPLALKISSELRFDDGIEKGTLAGNFRVSKAQPPVLPEQAVPLQGLDPQSLDQLGRSIQDMIAQWLQPVLHSVAGQWLAKLL